MCLLILAAAARARPPATKDPFPERADDGFDPVLHREHIQAFARRRRYLLEERDAGRLSELEFLGERAKLRAHAGIIRAGGRIPLPVDDGPPRPRATRPPSASPARRRRGAAPTPSRRATVDPALKRRLLESIGVAPVKRRPGPGRAALAVAAAALVAAAGALLLLERQCRVGRQGHSGRLPAALAQFVRAAQRGRAADGRFPAVVEA